MPSLEAGYALGAHAKLRALRLGHLVPAERAAAEYLPQHRPSVQLRSEAQVNPELRPRSAKWLGKASTRCSHTRQQRGFMSYDSLLVQRAIGSQVGGAAPQRERSLVCEPETA